VQTDAAGQGRSIQYLRFRNYYCAEIVVKRFVAGRAAEGEGSNEWRTVCSKQLMSDPNDEAEAQNWHVVDLGDAMARDGHSDLMRIYLVQPSMLWKRVELHSIQLFATDNPMASSRLRNNKARGGASPGGLGTSPRNALLDGMPRDEINESPADALMRSMSAFQTHLGASVALSGDDGGGGA